MAGGVWFLGQAVAQADEQANNVGQDNSQSATSEDGGITGNIGGNANFSSNEVDIDIETDVEGGDGGANYSNVNTGVQGAFIVVESGGGGGMTNSVAPPNGGHHGGDAELDLNIETGSVSVEQNANGGNVSGSGNVDLGGLKLPDQTNNVHQVNNQTATSEDDGHHGRPHHDGPDMVLRGMNSGGHGGLTGNLGGNLNFSRNEVDIDIETDVEGGDGGYNESNVNTGLQDVFLVCESESWHGDAECDIDIKTGHVSVVQNANGGNVSDSGNVGFGGRKDHDGHDARRHHDRDKHEAEVKPAARPAAKASAPSSAQPKGALAFTGSTGDGSGLPLTLGLLALGLGGALTLAGRRRETTTA
jgi:hypothetical protein